MTWHSLRSAPRIRDGVARRRGHRRREVGATGLVRQIVLVALAALAYFGVRGVTQGAVGTALDHAGDVIGAEQVIGVAWEASLQNLIIDHAWLVAAANWVYIYGHWPVVIGVLIWLFIKRREAFFALRDAIFISGAIGLVVFMAFPTAPPRLVELGLLDTVTDRSSSYRALQPPGLINKYAAMPSLHFGWNLLVGVVLFRLTGRRIVRVFAIGLPVAMGFAVVATANHYVLDVLAGAVVALAGLRLVGVVNRVVLALRWSRAE